MKVIEDRFKLSKVLTGSQPDLCIRCGRPSVGAFHYRNDARPEKSIPDAALCAYDFADWIDHCQVPLEMLTDAALDIIERQEKSVARLKIRSRF